MRPIAFYLPQFHRIQENDAWWGDGYTEWDRVRSAVPRFPGHVAPGPPGELGEYDLADSAVLARQAVLAAEHGIHAFCFYHYWFQGRRLLHRPVDSMLGSGRPDFPFLLCWANESWSRRWDGGSGELLIAQDYSAADDERHMRFLLEVFADRRYVRVQGRPLFLVYRPSDLPEADETIRRWRREAERAGVAQPFLAAVESVEADKRDWRQAGFDINIEFQPDWWYLGPRLSTRNAMAGMKLDARRLDELEDAGFFFYRYEEIVDRMLARPRPAWARLPCVVPRWDNTPRRGDSGLVLHGSRPELFERWCRAVGESWMMPGEDLDLVFINSWNEWSEGAHLEPDRRHGRAYLEAARAGLFSSRIEGWTPPER